MSPDRRQTLALWPIHQVRGLVNGVAQQTTRLDHLADWPSTGLAFHVARQTTDFGSMADSPSPRLGKRCRPADDTLRPPGRLTDYGTHYSCRPADDTLWLYGRLASRRARRGHIRSRLPRIVLRLVLKVTKAASKVAPTSNWRNKPQIVQHARIPNPCYLRQTTSIYKTWVSFTTLCLSIGHSAPLSSLCLRAYWRACRLGTVTWTEDPAGDGRVGIAFPINESI